MPFAEASVPATISTTVELVKLGVEEYSACATPENNPVRAAAPTLLK